MIYPVWMAREYPHVISFRVTTSEGRKLQALRSTFPEQKWGELFRWLLEQPDVQNVIQQRFMDEQAQAQPERGGVDFSLPLGDRE